MPYIAFISYSHAADSRLAEALQSALHKFAKPWYRLRAIRIFRDTTNLSINPSLWESIERSLCESEFFILMASPKASESKWIKEEVDFWIKNRSMDKLLIVLTGGELVWDNKINAFKKTKTTSIPENLINALKKEPLWVDLRWAETEEHLSVKHPKFREVIAKIASTLHNKPLDEISGEEVRQHRKTKRIAWSAVILLMLLTITAVFAAIIAENRRVEAVKQRFFSISQALTLYAFREANNNNDELAALLARQAYIFNNRYKSDRKDYIDKALRDILNKAYFSVCLNGGKEKPKITSAAYSRDNKFLAVGGQDMNIRIWNLKEPGEKPKILKQSNGIIWALAFNPQSNFLSAGTGDGYVLFWNYNENGVFDSVQILNSQRFGKITSVMFNQGGQSLASGSVDGNVRVWNVSKIADEPIQLNFDQNKSIVKCLSFNPKLNDILAVGREDSALYIWDINRSSEPMGIIRGFDNAVNSVAFSKDGLMMACGTDKSVHSPSFTELLKGGYSSSEGSFKKVGGNIFLYDLQKLSEGPVTLNAHDDDVTSLSFSPDGKYLASSGGADKTVKLWELNQLNNLPVILEGHDGYISNVLFSPDGYSLTSVGSDKSSVRIWRIGNPSGSPISLVGHKRGVQSLNFSPDGNYLFSSGGSDGTLRKWDLTNFEKKPHIFYHPDELSVVFATYNDYKKIIATGCKNILDYKFPIYLWDPDNSQEPKSILTGHKSAVECLAFNGNGEILVSAAKYDKEIWLWNIINTDEPSDTFSNLSSNVVSIALGKHNNFLAWGGEDGSIRFYNDLKTNIDPEVLIDHKGSVNSLVFTNDDNLIVSGGEDGKILLWNLTDIQASPTQLDKNIGAIKSIAIDNSGMFLVTGDSDGIVRFYNLKDINSEALIFNAFKSAIYSVAISENGRWFAAGGGENKIIVWQGTEMLANMVNQQVHRNLSRDEWNEFIGSDVDYESTCPNLPPGENVKPNK